MGFLAKIRRLFSGRRRGARTAGQRDVQPERRKAGVMYAPDIPSVLRAAENRRQHSKDPLAGCTRAWTDREPGSTRRRGR